MGERRKLAGLGAFFVMWGLGIVFIGLLLIDPIATRVVAGIGILFIVLGTSFVLPFALKLLGQMAKD